MYHPQQYALGLGCARGCDVDEMWALVQKTLAEAGIAEGAVACVGSLDLKGDEPAMIETAARWGVPYRVFTAPSAIPASANVFCTSAHISSTSQPRAQPRPIANCCG